MRHLKVKEIMNKNVIFVPGDENVLKIADILVSKGIGSVLVYDENKKGIISKTDIIREIVLKNKDPLKTKAREIMNSNLITINWNETLEEAAKKMKEYKVGRLVVLDDQGRIAGIISRSDIAYIEPSLVDLLEEEVLIDNYDFGENIKISGYCDACGNYSDDLKLVGDMYLCEECRGDYE